MRSEAGRLMAETAILRGWKEIRQGDCRRALRGLAEDAGRFAQKGYSSALLGEVRQMLRAGTHPYYELFSHLAATVDSRYLTGFFLNLCYESWIRGARVLRAEQRRLHCAIPWLISLDMDGLGVSRAAGLMEQGEALGIRAFILITRGAPAEALRALSLCFPRCALAAFAPDEALASADLDTLEGADNLLLAAVRGEGAFVCAPALQARKRLYALCRRVDADMADQLTRGADCACPGDAACPLPVLLASEGAPDVLCERLGAWVDGLRRHPRQALFPVELLGDTRRVGVLVSGSDRMLRVDGEGRYLMGQTGRNAGLRYPQTPLAEALVMAK